ncbi:hypothetical protein M1373_00395 [Candidatus Marsarchaeota archaeon]|nr:hypothetical protein [Candidatus Marsarchaeota archaeon]MCL5404475.1 hypothetical protein [Candidatus Marsarchaeota archaeon]
MEYAKDKAQKAGAADAALKQRSIIFFYDRASEALSDASGTGDFINNLRGVRGALKNIEYSTEWSNFPFNDTIKNTVLKNSELLINSFNTLVDIVQNEATKTIATWRQSIIGSYANARKLEYTDINALKRTIAEMQISSLKPMAGAKSDYKGTDENGETIPELAAELSALRDVYKSVDSLYPLYSAALNLDESLKKAIIIQAMANNSNAVEFDRFSEDITDIASKLVEDWALQGRLPGKHAFKLISGLRQFKQVFELSFSRQVKFEDEEPPKPEAIKKALPRVHYEPDTKLLRY